MERLGRKKGKDQPFKVSSGGKQRSRVVVDDDVDDTKPVDDTGKGNEVDTYDDSDQSLEEPDWDELFDKKSPGASKDNNAHGSGTEQTGKRKFKKKNQESEPQNLGSQTQKSPSGDKRKESARTAGAKTRRRKSSNLDSPSTKGEDLDPRQSSMPKGAKVIGTTKTSPKQKSDKQSLNQPRDTEKHLTTLKNTEIQEKRSKATKSSMGIVDKKNDFPKPSVANDEVTTNKKSGGLMPPEQALRKSITAAIEDNPSRIRSKRSSSAESNVHKIASEDAVNRASISGASQSNVPKVNYLFHDAEAAARLTGKSLTPKKPEDGIFSGSRALLKKLLFPPQPSQLARETPWLVKDKDASRQDKIAKYKFFGKGEGGL